MFSNVILTTVAALAIFGSVSTAPLPRNGNSGPGHRQPLSGDVSVDSKPIANVTAGIDVPMSIQCWRCFAGRGAIKRAVLSALGVPALDATIAVGPKKVQVQAAGWRGFDGRSVEKRDGDLLSVPPTVALPAVGADVAVGKKHISINAAGWRGFDGRSVEKRDDGLLSVLPAVTVPAVGAEVAVGKKHISISAAGWRGFDGRSVEERDAAVSLDKRVSTRAAELVHDAAN